jgi:hypothetical protein
MNSHQQAVEETRTAVFGLAALIELKELKINRIAETTRQTIKTKRNELKVDRQRLKNYQAILKKIEKER